jgi:hypothetical protein
MNIHRLPAALEIARLQRLKETFLGGENRKWPASIVAEEDWLAELDARLRHLRATLLGGPAQPGSSLSKSSRSLSR